MEKVFILLLIMAFSQASFSQDTERFDRFFTDRVERKQLDAARSRYLASFKNEQSKKPMLMHAAPNVIHLKGIVVRNDGSMEVWLNRNSALDKNPSVNMSKSDISLVGNGGVRLSLPGKKYVLLKPGQIYSTKNKRISEAYGRLGNHNTPGITVKRK